MKWRQPSMNFWKIFALALLVAVLLATAHMEYKFYHNQANNIANPQATHN